MSPEVERESSDHLHPVVVVKQAVRGRHAQEKPSNSCERSEVNSE